MQTDLKQLIASLPESAVVHATRLGLALAPKLEPEARRELVSQLSRLARSATGERHTVTTWVGDLLAYGGWLRHGQIAEFAVATGLDAGTLRNAKMVCLRIPLSRRHDALSWSHHCEVGLAFADPEKIEHWLGMAEHERIAAAELRRRIRLHVATASRTTPAMDSAPGFRLMRELRAAARATEQQRSVWTRWPASTAGLALEELQPLAKFLDAMRATVLANTARPPSDPGAN